MKKQTNKTGKEAEALFTKLVKFAQPALVLVDDDDVKLKPPGDVCVMCNNRTYYVEVKASQSEGPITLNQIRPIRFLTVAAHIPFKKNEFDYEWIVIPPHILLLIALDRFGQHSLLPYENMTLAVTAEIISEYGCRADELSDSVEDAILEGEKVRRKFAGAINNLNIQLQQLLDTTDELVCNAFGIDYVSRKEKAEAKRKIVAVEDGVEGESDEEDEEDEEC